MKNILFLLVLSFSLSFSQSPKISIDKLANPIKTKIRKDLPGAIVGETKDYIYLKVFKWRFASASYSASGIKALNKSTGNIDNEIRFKDFLPEGYYYTAMMSSGNENVLVCFGKEGKYSVYKGVKLDSKLNKLTKEWIELDKHEYVKNELRSFKINKKEKEILIAKVRIDEETSSEQEAYQYVSVDLFDFNLERLISRSYSVPVKNLKNKDGKYYEKIGIKSNRFHFSDDGALTIIQSLVFYFDDEYYKGFNGLLITRLDNKENSFNSTDMIGEEGVYARHYKWHLDNGKYFLTGVFASRRGYLTNTFLYEFDNKLNVVNSAKGDFNSNDVKNVEATLGKRYSNYASNSRMFSKELNDFDDRWMFRTIMYNDKFYLFSHFYYSLDNSKMCKGLVIYEMDKNGQVIYKGAKDLAIRFGVRHIKGSPYSIVTANSGIYVFFDERGVLKQNRRAFKKGSINGFYLNQGGVLTDFNTSSKIDYDGKTIKRNIPFEGVHKLNDSFYTFLIKKIPYIKCETYIDRLEIE